MPPSALPAADQGAHKMTHRNKSGSPPRGLRLTLLSLYAIVLAGCTQLPMPTAEEDRVRAELAERERQAARPASLCSPTPGTPFAFRKKVLLLSVPLEHLLEAPDLPGLGTTWSVELQQRLRSTDRFIVRDGRNFGIDAQADVRKQIIALGERFDAQFVVTGRIRTAGIQPGRIDLGPLKPIPLPMSDQRSIETVLEIYDTHTGTVVSRLSHAASVSGKVLARGNGSFDEAFFQTPIGEALDKALKQQAEDIEDQLACLPMQARITRTRLHEIFIDAGFTSNLNPGDRLRVLQRDEYNVERGYGDLVIKQVFPETALGYLDGGDRPNWKFNGFVRAW